MYLQPESAEVTERGCIPATLAGHVPLNRTEDSSAQPGTGPLCQSPAGVARPASSQVKDTISGEEIPEQKTEYSARPLRGARHLKSAAWHCCRLENQCLTQLHFEVELWCALGSKDSELLYRPHRAPSTHCQNLVSLFFSTSKVVHLPTQQKGRMVVFKAPCWGAESLSGTGSPTQGCLLPTTAEDVWGSSYMEHRQRLTEAPCKARFAVALHIWHGSGRLGPAGCVESSSSKHPALSQSMTFSSEIKSSWGRLTAEWWAGLSSLNVRGCGCWLYSSLALPVCLPVWLAACRAGNVCPQLCSTGLSWGGCLAHQMKEI